MFSLCAWELYLFTLYVKDLGDSGTSLATSLSEYPRILPVDSFVELHRILSRSVA